MSDYIHIDEILARHNCPELWYGEEHVCGRCNQAVPCDAARMAIELRAAREALGLNPVPVQQTKFGDPDGNCLEACFASLTGIPLGEIPHFLNAGWFGSYARWFLENGWHLLYWHGDETEAPVGYAIASGPAIRGLDHSTIYLNGKLHHDPHPSNSGLESVHDWMILVRKVALARYDERRT